jgi:hypothetical protein
LVSPLNPEPDEFEPEILPGPDTVWFPLRAILDRGPASIQYRAIVDVAGLEVNRDEVRNLALAYKPALQLALSQNGDGSWGHGMLAVPAPEVNGFAGVATIPACRRLLEYGWDRDTPPLLRSRRLLFRLLAEDNDANQLYEFAKEANADPDLIHRARNILREAAAATLAHAGYEGDPRLRGAARRILGRVDDFLQSPLAEKPWIRSGNRLVLAPEAYPPSLHVLTMIAHMPLFRSENHAPVSRLQEYSQRPAPRQDACQLVGKRVVAQPHLVLGDPLTTRTATEADVPFTLTWLELMARLQFLRGNESWLKAYERILADCDRDHVWRPRRAPSKQPSAHPEAWPLFPLGRADVEEDRSFDVTFRLGLIARLLGRPLEVV